jgi:alkaline phosphatase D
VTISRRGFLSRAAPGVLGLLPACAARDETALGGGEIVSGTPEDVPFELQPAAARQEAWPAPAESATFEHGVASGDPLSDAVILWTRVTPPAGGAAGDEIEVEWRIALDPEHEQLVAEGSVLTGAGRDYTVHVDATGLASGTTYYYQFRALGEASLRGRTRTLPSGAVQRLRLGVVSCANYPAGFFNVYGLLASADVDVVLHLGDYIYEYADGQLGAGAPIGRAPEPPGEVLTLQDYR